MAVLDKGHYIVLIDRKTLIVAYRQEDTSRKTHK